MSSRVHVLELAPGQPGLAVGPGPADLAAVVRAVGHAAPEAAWAVKVKVSPPGSPAWVEPSWAGAVRKALGCGPGSRCLDTVSIGTRGLDTPEAMAAQAAADGLDRVPGLPFRVADAEEFPAREGEPGRPASGTAGCRALAVLNPVRPHPHLGFRGAVAELGVGMMPVAAKLALHRDIRPAVDTPLCAGCGSCLDVCLYDAIAIRAGRAFIDHVRCTGCGECMTVCFMAGIGSEEQAGLERFQRAVAASARKMVDAFPGPRLFINLLVGLDRYTAGPGRRMALELHRSLVLAGTDPVAVDQAAWDHLRRACAGSMRNWHGYPTDPGVMLNAAEEAGLGSRAYEPRPVRAG